MLISRNESKKLRDYPLATGVTLVLILVGSLLVCVSKQTEAVAYQPQSPNPMEQTQPRDNDGKEKKKPKLTLREHLLKQNEIQRKEIEELGRLFEEYDHLRDLEVSAASTRSPAEDASGIDRTTLLGWIVIGLAALAQASGILLNKFHPWIEDGWKFSLIAVILGFFGSILLSI